MNENFILSSNNKTAFLESVSGDMPCIDVNTQRGGRFIVKSIADRNNIPKKKRTLGMKAYVVESGQEFILIKDSNTEHTTNDCWVDKFTDLQNDLLTKLNKLSADVTSKLNEMKSQLDQKIADLNRTVDVKISSVSSSCAYGFNIARNSSTTITVPKNGYTRAIIFADTKWNRLQESGANVTNTIQAYRNGGLVSQASCNVLKVRGGSKGHGYSTEPTCGISFEAAANYALNDKLMIKTVQGGWGADVQYTSIILILS